MGPCLETMMGSLNTSIMHSESSPSPEKRAMKQRQDTEVPAATTNTDVLLKVHQDLAKDRPECSFDGNMRMLAPVTARLFSSLNQHLLTPAPKGSYCPCSE